MGTFKNGFASFADKTCDPEKWAQYFLGYDSAEWDQEGDGVLYYTADNRLRYFLVICHWPDCGFLLDYSCRDLETRRTVSDAYPVGDREALGRFVEQDDLRFPLGCLLDPDRAWLVVEDFLRDPEKPSARVPWIASDDVDWPADML